MRAILTGFLPPSDTIAAAGKFFPDFGKCRMPAGLAWSNHGDDQEMAEG